MSSTHTSALATLAAAILTTTIGSVSPASAQAPSAMATAVPGIVATRRLTESQYRNTIADVFGADIQVNGRFEPEQREHLLLAIGGSALSISAAGFDQYFAIAKSVSDQVLDDKHRARFLTCQLENPQGVDDACTSALVKTYGGKLFRRPLTEAEVAPRIALAAEGTRQNGSYVAGLKLALTSLLTAPQFLFRVENAERDPSSANAVRLDGYTKAARLSYLLWNTTPDEELLASASTGEIHSAAGLGKQVSRLLSSPRVEAGTRAFFADMLQLDLYETLTKDPTIYPKFSQAVAEAAKEQTLKTVVYHLLTQNADYRDLFTTRTTFLDRSLASVYKVPLLVSDGWAQHDFPPDSDHSGLLTQISFLGLFSHPGRSSPTKRGVAINEILLCEPTPLPPANVDFSIVNDTTNPNLRTVRSRLIAHSEDESCSGCHRKSDPLGLALERFDSLGQHRTKENGAVIDVAAQLSGRKFEGARGLGQALHDNPKVAACVVRNVYAYGTGRAPDRTDRQYLDARVKAFIGEQYRFRPLLQQIVVSPEFFKVVPPKPAPDKSPSAVMGRSPNAASAGALERPSAGAQERPPADADEPKTTIAESNQTAATPGA